MIKHTLLYSAIVLSGCTATPQLDLSVIDGITSYTFIPHLTEAIPGNKSGMHLYDKATDTHHIYLIRSEFPRCLEHEVLHIIFGRWHKGRESIEYCSQ